MGTHEINLSGRAGSILWALIAAAMMYTVGFATTGWRVQNNLHVGLWETCVCGGESALRGHGETLIRIPLF